MTPCVYCLCETQRRVYRSVQTCGCCASEHADLEHAPSVLAKCMKHIHSLGAGVRGTQLFSVPARGVSERKQGCTLSTESWLDLGTSGPSSGKGYFTLRCGMPWSAAHTREDLGMELT